MTRLLILILSITLLSACNSLKTKEITSKTDPDVIYEPYYDMASIAHNTQAASFDIKKQHAIVLGEQQSYVVIHVKNYQVREPVQVDLSKIISRGVTPPPKPVKKEEPKELGYVVYFDTDKSNINEAAATVLESVINKVPKDAHISISGHTDQDGTDKYNMALSKKRANTVAKYFKKNGFTSVNSTYYGEKLLVTKETSKKAKSLNRRVQIELIDQNNGDGK